ncbi:transposase domain-containing protein [Streptomyces sp. NPDC006385]|uniref:transposase domain-containing protein n=1 Tax=Streptomyces sp. NPDC006385 TaxID=3156761 RepID=UPI0033A748BA
MPRPGQRKANSQGNLSDRIAVGLLLHTFPPDLVDRVLLECGRVERRSRLLPARTVVYFVLVISLFCQRSYGQVARLLTEFFAWACQGGDPGQLPPVPTTAALSRARARLGPEPLAGLFMEAVRRAHPARRRCDRYRRWRVLTVDAATVSVPDTRENRAQYGMATVSSEYAAPTPSALPQVRVTALAECGGHTITSAAVGLSAPATGPALTRELFTTLAPGDLVLAECAAVDLKLLPAVGATGADLLWRVSPGRPLPRHATLPDNSHLAVLPGIGAEVRVIEEHPYRLVTTLLDHEADPAPQLTALHHRYRAIGVSLEAVGMRWDEAPLVLRSRWPEGVEQEVWGHLLVHHALHSLMHPA